MGSYKGQHNNKIVNKHFKGCSNLLAERKMPVKHLYLSHPVSVEKRASVRAV